MMMLSHAALLAAVCGLIVYCQGVPVQVADDKPAELSAPSETQITMVLTTTTTTTTTTTAEPMIEGHPMDDLLPGSSSTTSQPATPATPTSLGFADVPQHTETVLGASVLLACRTTEPVVECQWSWRPLPPTSLPLPNIDDASSSESGDANEDDDDDNDNDDPTNATTSATAPTSEAEASLSLPVRKFPAFGNASNDCSVRFSSVKHEQTGYWTCAARRRSEDASFTGAPAARLSIVVVVQEQQQPKFRRPQQQSSEAPSTTDKLNFTEAPESTSATVLEEGEVRFSELSQDFQITSGATDIHLRCVTMSQVEMCRWSLTSQVSGNTTVVVKEFKPAGPEARDCSVRLSHALPTQEGFWTCGARLRGQNYTDAPPARLSLIEPVVKELPADCHLRSIKPSIESTLVADSPSEKSR